MEVIEIMAWANKICTYMDYYRRYMKDTKKNSTPKEYGEMLARKKKRRKRG